MASVLTNVGDAQSLFASAQAGNQSATGALINTQIDPTLPESTALSRVTDPVLPDENSQWIVRNFDPDLYDLRPTSHIMRLVKAMTGGAGIGGLKKQMIVSRMASTLALASFSDLDAFYGAIFNFNRYGIESLPVNDATGAKLNPYTDVATPETWDDALSRDARYRSRVFQVARAINMGGSISGIKGVCEALLSCEVDVSESWERVDASYLKAWASSPSFLTFANIRSQNVTYGAFRQPYNLASGGQYGVGIAPEGNRAEVVISPRRIITDEEKLQLTKVIRTLRPSHTMITLGGQVSQATAPVPALRYMSDSEDWEVIPRLTPASNLVQPIDALYANSGQYSVARPVFSEYSGEAWTYNASIVRTYSYQIVDGQTISTPSTETITYQDQTSHVYAPGDGVMDVRQALGERLSGDGVVTAFPFTGPRQTVNQL